MPDEKLNFIRNIFLIPVTLFVLCIFAYGGLWALSNYKDPQLARASEQQHNLPKGSTNYMPILCFVIPFAGWGLYKYISRPYHAQRGYRHVYAEILWEKDRYGNPMTNKIIVHNVDTIDSAELGRYVHWSSCYAAERQPSNHYSNDWIWKFHYMGDKRIGWDEEENFFSDPYHISEMKGAVEVINMFADDYLNPVKDAELESKGKK